MRKDAKHCNFVIMAYLPAVDNVGVKTVSKIHNIYRILIVLIRQTKLKPFPCYTLTNKIKGELDGSKGN